MSEYPRESTIAPVTTSSSGDAPASVTTSSPTRALQLKASLVGHDYDTQVQMLASEARSPTDVHAAAETGISGSAGPLPHKDVIQRSFGGYDVSNVWAHVDAAAQNGAAAMGANAYATGNHVVLGKGGDDLHTTAHEAAHVVQQRAGVSLSGGVGAAGDPYEQHADRVADAVVAGQSAEPILAEMAGGAGDASGAVQRKVVQRDEREPETPESDGQDKSEVEESEAPAELDWEAKRAIVSEIESSIQAFVTHADSLRRGVGSGFTAEARKALAKAEEALQKYTWDVREKDYHAGRLARAKESTLLGDAASQLRSCAQALESMSGLTILKPAEHYLELVALLEEFGASSSWTETDQRRLDALDGAAALYETLATYPTPKTDTVQAVEAAVSAFGELAQRVTSIVPDGDPWPRLVSRASELRRRLASDIVYAFPWDRKSQKIQLADVETAATELARGKAAFDRLLGGHEKVPLDRPVTFEAWATWQDSTLPAVRALVAVMTPWQQALDEVSPEAGLNQAETVDDAFVARLEGKPESAKEEWRKLPFGLGPQFEVDVHKPERRTDEVRRVRATNTRFQEAEPERLDALASEHALDVAELEKQKNEALELVKKNAVPAWQKLRVEMAALAEWKKQRSGRDLTAEEKDFLNTRLWRIYSTGVTLSTPAALFQDFMTYIGDETLKVSDDDKSSTKASVGKNGGLAGTGLALTNGAEKALGLADRIPDLPAVGTATGLQVFGRYIQRRGQGWDVATASGSAMAEGLLRGVAYFLLPGPLKLLFGVMALGGTVSGALATRSEGRQTEEDAGTLSNRLQTLLALKKDYERNDFEPLVALTDAVADYTRRLEALQKAGG